MIRIVATMAMAMAMAMAACATDEAQNTSSLDQDVTTQTCTPTYDPAPAPKGGYLFCTVHAFNGSTYFVHSTEADCVCGAVLNHELCVEYNYPEDLAYCNHNPLGGGGGGGT